MEFSDWNIDKLQIRAKILQKDLQKDESLAKELKERIKDKKQKLLEIVDILDKRKDEQRSKYLKKKF